MDEVESNSLVRDSTTNGESHQDEEIIERIELGTMVEEPLLKESVEVNLDSQPVKKKTPKKTKKKTQKKPATSKGKGKTTSTKNGKKLSGKKKKGKKKKKRSKTVTIPDDDRIVLQHSDSTLLVSDSDVISPLHLGAQEESYQDVDNLDQTRNEVNIDSLNPASQPNGKRTTLVLGNMAGDVARRIQRKLDLAKIESSPDVLQHTTSSSKVSEAKSRSTIASPDELLNSLIRTESFKMLQELGTPEALVDKVSDDVISSADAMHRRLLSDDESVNPAFVAEMLEKLASGALGVSAKPMTPVEEEHDIPRKTRYVPRRRDHGDAEVNEQPETSNPTETNPTSLKRNRSAVSKKAMKIRPNRNGSARRRSVTRKKASRGNTNRASAIHHQVIANRLSTGSAMSSVSSASSATNGFGTRSLNQRRSLRSSVRSSKGQLRHRDRDSASRSGWKSIGSLASIARRSTRLTHESIGTTISSWIGEENELMRTQHESDFQEMIENLKNPNYDPGENKQEAIRTAAAKGQEALVALLLLDKRVNPSVCDDEALRFAAANGFRKVVTMLMADPRVNPAAENQFALRWACRNGHHKVVERLIRDERVEPTVDDNYPIRIAAACGFAKVVEVLLRDDWVDPSSQNNYAIRQAKARGHSSVVRILLADGRVDPQAAEIEKGCSCVVL